MFSRKLYALLACLTIFATLLGACKQQPASNPAPAKQNVENTQAVEEKQIAPTEAQEIVQPAPTTRTGAWLDSITLVEQNSTEAAVSQLNAGDIDVFNDVSTNGAVFKTVKDSPNLTYNMAYGTTYQYMFNPYGPEFKNGKLNPFSDQRIREAMNYMVDRSYVTQEILNGLGISKLLPICGVFPDAARYVDIVAKLTSEYAYNPEKAKAIVDEEMPKLGATKGPDGKWQYKGEPVTLIFLIRVEDERKQMGHYFANQLETLGFTIDRQEKKKAEAAPIWLAGEPSEGQWHIYTGSNVWNRIDRDAGSNFDGFYTTRGGTEPYYQAMKPDPEFDQVSLALSTNNFKTMDERRQLWEKALELSLKDSEVVWVADASSFTPYVRSLTAVGDLAGAILTSDTWPYTLKWNDQEGGNVTIAMKGLLTQPWNPIAGGNFVDDQFPIRAIGDKAAIYDPFTGLGWPQRLEKAEITAKEGLPIAKTLDWVDLKFVPEVKVPTDAWADWDAKAQKFITVGEKYPDGMTANVKIVVTYPKELFQTIKWQDGSPLSVGDFVMDMIMAFDQAKKDSPIYDESAEPNYDALVQHLKGLRIVSTDPLVIETYENTVSLDAEWLVKNVISGGDGTSWWPFYSRGEAPWHTLTIASLAEADKKIAFSSSKADELKVEWTNFISGPSLEIMKEYMGKASSNSYIPYAPAMSQYVTTDEAKARYQNIAAWYAAHNHFWVGTGPYYLDKAYVVEKTLTLLRNPFFADPADKWSRFGEAKIADVAVDGPANIKIGSDATFDITITFKDTPYTNADLSAVKYLVFNAQGELVYTSDAQAVEDGHYQAVLDKDITSKLVAGSNKITIAVSPLVVSIPSFQSFIFVTTP